MSAITYSRFGTSYDAEIHFNGRNVGLLIKEPCALGILYVIVLWKDPRRIQYVRSRSLLPKLIEERIATHPDLEAIDMPARKPNASCIPF